MWPCVKSLQSCPTLWDPIDCNPPGSSVHGILQARKLEWVSMPSFRGSFQPRDWTCVSYVSCISRPIVYHRRLGNPPCDLGQVNSFCWASSPATLRLDSVSKLGDLNKYCSLSSVCRGADASARGLVQVSILRNLSRVFQCAARDANQFSRSLFFNWGSQVSNISIPWMPVRNEDPQHPSQDLLPQNLHFSKTPGDPWVRHSQRSTAVIPCLLIGDNNMHDVVHAFPHVTSQ